MEFQTATVTGATGHLGNVLVRELNRPIPPRRPGRA
jgi:hypothetical protein